ncbi:hypothetical protein GC197_17720 [bacterium]|nr:hypothetical protein [bacterium]
MDDREQIRQQMLELIYGLLSDQESAELVQRISSDGVLARDYAELKEQTELLAEVAKVQVPVPSYDRWKKAAGELDEKPTPKKSASQKPATGWASPTLQLFAALAACLLIAALAYPMVSIDRQEETIALANQEKSLAGDFLAVSVTGPSLMAAEVRNDFFVSIENAAAEPVDADVEYTFKSPQGDTVYYGLTKAVNGQVVCQIPPDEVSSAAKLEVVARNGKTSSQLGLDLKVAPPKPIAILQTDREMAEPGKPVNFRAVVLDPQTNRDQSAEVDFVWGTSNRRQLSRIASAEKRTLNGVAQGQLKIPAEDHSPNVELGVQSSQLQNSFEQRALPVVDQRINNKAEYFFENSRRYKDAYGRRFTGVAQAAKPMSQLETRPEGGNLVAGVQNRLLFLANSDRASKPAKPGFPVLRGAEKNKQKVTTSENMKQQYGYFDFTPEPSLQYTLEVTEESQPPLQQTISQAQPLPAAMQVNNGVARADEPLEVDVRVAQANTTLALIASDGQNTIGHNLWDVGVNAPITQPVQLDLPTEAVGAQRLQLYALPNDENKSKGKEPELIAERIIYRIPVQRFDVDVEGLPEMAQTGDTFQLHVNVSDEYDSPVQATLGVQMERLSDVLPESRQPLGLEGELFLNRRVQVSPAAESLPDNIRELEKDSVWFDQVLALSTWKDEPQSNDANSTMLAAGEKFGMAPQHASLPVMRQTNKRAVQSDYQQAIAALHADWENRLESIRQTSSWMLSVAGVVLAVCLIGLALLQGRPKVGIWGPGLVVAVGAILWGMVSLNLALPEFSSTSGDAEMVAMNSPAPTASPPISASESAPHDEELHDSKPFDSKWNGQAPAMEQPQEANLADRTRKNELQPVADYQRNAHAMQPAQVELKAANLAEAKVLQEKSLPAMGGGMGGMGAGGAPGMGMMPLRVQAMSKAQDANNDSQEKLLETENLETLRRNFAPQPILWQPRLMTTPQGQATLSVQLPDQPGRYRLLIDAHGSGRLGTLVRYIDVAPAMPPASEKTPPVEKKAAN